LSWKGKRPLGKPRRGWEYNIRMDLVKIGCGGVNWIGLAQDKERRRALVTMVMNLRVAKTAGKLSSGYTAGGVR
jgi:hypothetical protein